jgi:predicted transposase YbfD/YdcC
MRSMRFPSLLSLLDLSGTVTIDAIGCQSEIARHIVEAEGHYVLAVKQNQATLYRKVKAFLDEAILDDFDGMHYDHFQLVEGDHGRIETRRLWVTDEVHWLNGELRDHWPGLASVAAVECTREDSATGKSSNQRCYFISSIPGIDAKTMAEAVHGHWAIENKLHWRLDVSFNEGQRRIRKDHGAENFSRLCRLALNLLKRDKSVKIGIHGKRLKA